MAETSRNTLIGGGILAAFALIATALVAMTFDVTKERISENERQLLLRSLHTLVPDQRYDNDLYSDRVQLAAPSLVGKQNTTTVYRARKAGQPVTAILEVIAADGYSGAIKLLVAINYDGVLAGVRVVKHKETPGLGDAIDERRSDWINTFNGRSLENPGSKQWKVKKDGGVFDQFTGATITPRAVVKAVHKALNYYAEHRQQIFTDTVEGKG